MSFRFSTGQRNAALKNKSFRKMFEDGILYIFTGSQPATADLGATGSLLVAITKASGAVSSRSTRQVSQCKVTTLGAVGDTHVLTINGTAYTYTVVSGDTVDTVAQKLAELVDQDANVSAVCAGGSTVTESVIILRGRFGGVSFTAIASNTGTAVLSTVEAYIAMVSGNGLKFGDPASGVISKDSDVWSGVGVLDGTAGWFRLCEYGDTPTSQSSTAVRLDGSIGVGLGDLRMGNTAIESGATITINGASFTAPYQQ